MRRDPLEQAAESYDAAGDLEGLARVTVTMGLSPALVDTTLTGSARITALLTRLERGGISPPLRVALYEALGLRLFTAGEYEASLAASERAATLARACGDERTQALAERNRVNILQMLGRLGEALQGGQTALPLVETSGDPQRLVWLLTDLAYIHALRGAFATSRRYIDRALTQAEQLVNPADLSFALAIGRWLAVLSGEWPRARADLERATSVSSVTDRSWYSSYPPIFLARLSLAQGEWTAATVAVREALALAQESGDLQALRWASTTMAELEILEGRAAAARARLVPLLDRAGLEECDVTALLPVLAWAQLELGAVDEAAATVEQALRRARPEEMHLVVVEALRVQALVLLRREQWDEAARSLAEGLALARAMPYPYAEARLLHLDGTLRAQQGEGAAACEPWVRVSAMRVSCVLGFTMITWPRRAPSRVTLWPVASSVRFLLMMRLSVMMPEQANVIVSPEEAAAMAVSRWVLSHTATVWVAAWASVGARPYRPPRATRAARTARRRRDGRGTSGLCRRTGERGIRMNLSVPAGTTSNRRARGHRKARFFTRGRVHQ